MHKDLSLSRTTLCRTIATSHVWLVHYIFLIGAQVKNSILSYTNHIWYAQEPPYYTEHI